MGVDYKGRPERRRKLAYWVRRSSDQDQQEEAAWRRRKIWGDWLIALRQAADLTRVRLAHVADVSQEKLEALESGRDEPFLSEANRLAKELGVSLEDLVCDDNPGDWWIASANKQSDARALAFRAREARDGEMLSPGVELVFEVVKQFDDKREKIREAVKKIDAKRQQENAAKLVAMFKSKSRATPNTDQH